MPHSNAPEQKDLLANFLDQVTARSALHHRIAGYEKLLAAHDTTAQEFLENLDEDELEFFLTCPPRQVYPEVKRWLRYLATRPTTKAADRRVRLLHGYERRYEKACITSPGTLGTLALRLRTVFVLRAGILTWEPLDVPWAQEEDFLAWLSPEAVPWSFTLGREVFRATVRAWLEKYFSQVGLPRLSGHPVHAMASREHQRILVESENHFDLRTRRAAEEEGVEWVVDVPPAPALGITVVGSHTN